ncbi:MAG: hypothetical protein WDN26_19055 [Chitinophagaceae bacterium]
MLLFRRMKKNFSHPVSIYHVLLCYCLFFFNTARSQPASSSDASMAEKIYLQPDNKVYTTDQTIWFKAIVTQASNHIPSKISEFCTWTS